jgi:hypothetical protein
VHLRRSPLGIVGGCAGRHRALSPGTRCVASVAGRFGRNTVGFRERAGETVHGGVTVVHHGAGQGWRRVGSRVPCR